MADDKYDKVLLKAEIKGISSLDKNELELFKKLVKEMSARGRKAARMLD